MLVQITCLESDNNNNDKSNPNGNNTVINIHSVKDEHFTYEDDVTSDEGIPPPEKT